MPINPNTVAVIGCSHSDLDFIDNNSIPNHDQAYSWIYHAAEDFPHLEFYSFARGGQGSLYFDLCMKHAVQQGYKHVIIQLSTETRFVVPIWDKNFNKPTWKEDQISKNLINFDYQFNTVSITSDQAIESIRQGQEDLNIKNSMFDQMSGSATPHIYSDLFCNTIEQLYQDNFSSFIYFTAWNRENNYNNINQSDHVFDYMFKKYGKYHCVKNLMDDSLHMNYQGSKIWYNEYLKQALQQKIILD